MQAIELLADFVERYKSDDKPICHNEWLNGDDMSVYVRRSVPRILNDGEKYVTLDIASINVYQQSQGHFTAFLAEAEKLNPWPAIYVENVLQPRFEKFFKKKGYTQAKIYPASFYKMKGANA